MGEHTQVFKYGEKEEENPRLIDQYISYFKEGDNRRREMTKVTQSLVKNRSRSEDAFFRPGARNSNISYDRGVTNRGLIGAEGTAPSKSPSREVFMQKEGTTRRLRQSRVSQSFVESKETPPGLSMSMLSEKAQEVRPSVTT